MMVVFNLSSWGWENSGQFFLIIVKKSKISPESVRGLELEVRLKI